METKNYVSIVNCLLNTTQPTDHSSQAERSSPTAVVERRYYLRRTVAEPLHRSAIERMAGQSCTISCRSPVSVELTLYLQLEIIAES